MLAEMVLGVIVLLLGAEVFVRGSVALARLLKWSPLVIGVTVVAIGTSMPEMTVSVLAAIRGDYGLALGNIVGSNVVNSLLVLSVGILVGSIRIGTTKTPKNALAMMLATVFYWYWHITGNEGNSYWAYIALLGVVVFTTLEIWWAWWGKNHEDEHLSHKDVARNKNWILFIPLALFTIVVGGNLVVTSIEQMSVYYGISTTILGLVLSSIATSLPELATTLVGIRQKQEKLVIGNILGSNIYNLLLVGGVVGFWRQKAALSAGTWIVFLFSALLTLIIVEMYKGKHLPKKLVWWLLAGFGGYLLSIF